MSLLEALRSRRTGLNRTRTKVTRADGTQYVEDGDTTTELPTKNYGFVVDTKPDKIPAKIVEYLYLGSQDAAEISVLREYDIKYVLSLGVESATYEGVVNKYLRCLDLPETRLADVVDEACVFIDAAMCAKRNVLVHCNAGVSRLPAIVIAYLMRRHRMSYHDALAHVQHLRPSARPNDGFARQLSSLDSPP